MMNYHKGVSFDSYIINNDGGIYLLDVVEKAIPTPIIQDDKIIDYENGVLLVSIGIRDFRDSRASKVQEVLSAIMSAKKLKFNDEQQYHEILNIANIDKAYQEPFLQLDVTVSTKPYKYEDEPKKALTSIITQKGNYKAHTLLEVVGNANINGMSISGASGTVYINSEDKTAYTISGGKKVNALQHVTGDNFLVLSPGANQITFSGSVQISYKHTYLY